MKTSKDFQVRPGSDAKLFMNQDRPKLFRPPKLIQTPILIPAKLLTKYIIRIYALGLVREKFGV